MATAMTVIIIECPAPVCAVDFLWIGWVGRVVRGSVAACILRNLAATVRAYRL